jgi:RNA polymerase sigma factor (sigma-70 family)
MQSTIPLIQLANISSCPEAFPNTHWSIVLAAGQGESAAEVALEQLCRAYWYPLYAFIRRRGFDPHAAEDLTQSFFAYLLEKETLKRADRQHGKFRTFLLAALTNFLANEWDKRQTIKRGGRHQIISLDDTEAEERYRHELVESVTPEKLFERQWALTLIELVAARLARDYAAAGRAPLFAQLESCLTGEVSRGKYAEWGAALGMSEGALKVALHRMRRRYGELLREEIARTVTCPAEVDEEIRCLCANLSR